MSKNVKKLTPEEIQIRDADAAQAKLDTRGHEFATQDGSDTTAPLGLQRSEASSVTGPNVYDAIESLSSVGQLTALRALANSAICAAVFAGLQYFTDEDEEKAEDAHVRMCRQAELYSYAAQCMQPLAMTPFDKPMTLSDAIDFASSTATDQRKNEELPDEFLEQLGVSRSHLALIDAEADRKRAKRDAELRQSFRDNAEAITAEVSGFIDVDGASVTVLDSLNAQQHQALFVKAVGKLGARITQLLAIRGRYQGALADALMISSDAKTLDKAYTAFARANAGELREAA